MDDLQQRAAPSRSSASGVLDLLVRGTEQYLGGDRKLIAWLAIGLLLVGVVLRVWNFGCDRSLWLDEAMVATSILGRTWGELLSPLDYAQMAPVGWLLVEKAFLQTLGGLEHTLRLPQLVVGLASLALFTLVARKIFDHWGFLVAVALFSLAGPLVYYSAEVKPYGWDAFFSVAFILAAVRYFIQKEPLTAVGAAGLTLVGAAAIACSFPAVVVMASFGSVLFAREMINRRYARSIGVAVIGGLWLILFAYVYLTFYKTSSPVVETMTGLWSGGFAPLPPKSAGDLKWYGQAGVDLFGFMFGQEAIVATILAAAIGAWTLVRRNRLFGLAIIGPFAIALLVSGLHLYPVGGRLALHLLPLMILLVAVGADAIIASIRPRLIALGVAGALLISGSIAALWQGFTYFPVPYGTENIRPVLQEVAARRTATQPIYVDVWALPAFRLYQPYVGLSDAKVIEGKSNKNDLGCLLATIDSLRHHEQVWVIYSHADHLMNQSEEDVFAQFAEVVGKETYSLHSVSVHAYLFEFDSGSADTFAALRRAFPPAVACE